MHKIEDLFVDVLKRYCIAPSQESPLLLAISGGKDSMALLYTAYVTLPKGTYIAVYINHGIRSESSSDGEFIKGWCRDREVMFIEQELHLDLSDMSNLESRAREARYETLHSIATTYHTSCIVTAHHQTDQSETVMMRWLSGSSLAGLAGMQIFSNGILRPFLSISQNEILAYIYENNIEWREDSTNKNDLYRRNWLRNSIFPQIREKYSSLDKKMSEFAEYAQEVNEYLEKQVEKFLQENNFGEDSSFSVVSFQESYRALQSAILAYIYKQRNHGSHQGLDKGNIAEMRRYILTAQGATRKEFKGFVLTKKQSRVFVGNK